MNGLTEENLKVNGKKTICMERVYILGRMVENIKEIITWIKNTDLEFIDGRTEEFMKEPGLMENSMEKEYINYLINNQKREFGKMAKELDGLNNLLNYFKL